jgi:hypothetical protein
LLYAVSCLLCGAYIGFWQGTVNGARETILEGQLGQEVFPIIGHGGAAFVARIYLVAEEPEPDPEEITARMASFVSGEWEMDVETLQSRLELAKRSVIDAVTEETRRDVYEAYPNLEGSLGEDIFNWVLGELTRSLLKSAGDGTSIVSRPFVDLLEDLDKAAERGGDHSAISYEEMTRHIVEVGIVPLVMLPIEHFARSQQMSGVLPLLIVVVFTVMLFALLRYRRARRARKPKGSEDEEESPQDG